MDFMTGNLVREGMMMLASVGGPLFGALLIVGLVMGVLQAATQINDSAVSFLPRAAAGMAVCWMLGRWMMENLAGFLAQAMEKMAMRPF